MEAPYLATSWRRHGSCRGHCWASHTGLPPCSDRRGITHGFPWGRESGARGVARQNFRRDAWCRWLCDHGPTARTLKRSCAGLSKTCCPTPLVSLRPGGGGSWAVYMVRCARHIGGVGARLWVWYVWMAWMAWFLFDVRPSVCNDQDRKPKDPPSGRLDRSLDNYRPFPVPQRHELVTPEPDAMPKQACKPLLGHLCSAGGYGWN